MLSDFDLLFFSIHVQDAITIAVQHPPHTAAAPGAPPPEAALRIGDWQLVPSTHSLIRGETLHRLPRRLVDLLLQLASRPGQTWLREDLLEAVWQRKVVNDEVLSRAIAELRGLLGDDARTPRYIETLPKTGYRLVASVSRGDDGSASPVDRPAPGPSARHAARGGHRLRRSGRPALAAALLALAAWWLLPNEDAAREATGRAELAPARSDWSAADLVREQPFRSGPHWAWQPNYSRDGRWLAYAVSDLDGGETWLEWAAADGRGSKRVQTGSGRPAAPVFSPGGARLAFTAWEAGRCTLRVVHLPAGAPRDLGACGGHFSFPLDWPGADRLLFTAPGETEGQAGGLWQVDPDSGARLQLTTPTPGAVFDSHPRERGDGTLAFLRGPDGQRALWLRQAGAERQPLAGAHRIPDMAWTPDGHALLIASDLDGFPALHWLAPDSGELRLLGGRGAASLALAPDGSLLFERRRYDANLWAYGDGAPRRLTESTRYEAFAALAGDGESMLYVSNQHGNGSVWLQRGGIEQRLALPPARAWVRPQWLDKESLLLTRYAEDGATSVAVFDLATQHLRDDHPLSGPGFAAQAMADGQLLLGRGHEGGVGMQLLIRGQDGDHEIPGATQVAEFHSDGHWIGWTRRGGNQLQLRRAQDLQDDSASLALRADVAAWSLHAGQLVFAAPDDRGWALWRQRLDGGDAERWLELRAAPADGRIAMDPGGQRAVVSHVDEFSADLVRVPARP